MPCHTKSKKSYSNLAGMGGKIRFLQGPKWKQPSIATIPDYIPNHCHPPDPPHFSLLSPFKVAKYEGAPYVSWIFLCILPFLMMLLHASTVYRWTRRFQIISDRPMHAGSFTYSSWTFFGARTHLIHISFIQSRDCWLQINSNIKYSSLHITHRFVRFNFYLSRIRTKSNEII